MKNPVIALAQVSFPSTFTGALKLKSYIQQASKKGADIICFPETIIANDLFDHKKQILDHIGPECKKCGIWAVIGTITEDSGEIYNSAILINRKGKIAGVYNKQHLLGCELDNSLSPGSEPGIFETDFGKVGIVVCYDIFSPTVLAQYEDKDIQILLCPSNMVIPIPNYEKRQRDFVEVAIPTAIAVQLNCVFGIAMVYGEDLISHSQIVSPKNIIASLENKEGIVIGEINPQDLKLLPIIDMTEEEINKALMQKGISATEQ